MSPKTWKNWAKNVSCKPKNIFSPNTEDEIITIVEQCREQHQNIRLVGAGHSFTELVKTDDVILSLKNYHGALTDSLDSNSHELTILAGTTLKELGQLLYAQGLAMENLGDIDKQSIAGAISTGTHGTGLALQSIANQVTELELITGSSKVLKISEKTDRDTFKAAQVSLGALGIISKVRLRLIPAYNLEVEKKKDKLNTCLEDITAHRTKNRHFEFFWFPYTNTIQRKIMNFSVNKVQNKPVRRYFNDVLLENVGLGMLAYPCRVIPATFMCKMMNKIGAVLISNTKDVNSSYKAITTPRWVKFIEMEYAVPMDEGVDTLTEIKTWIEKNNIRVEFPVEFRYVKGDDIFLSPFYQRDSAVIAVHMLKGMPWKKYFEGCEKILRSHTGRPHWGKRHTLKAKDFARLYPKWQDFQTIRKKLDPDNIFLTPYLKTLFIEE